MKMNCLIFVLLVVTSVVVSVPLDLERTEFDPTIAVVPTHRLFKRFINPSMTSVEFSSDDFSKIRAKRNAEECEKLALCKLHARSTHNFIAAFELYFVNKENARLWDHRTHSLAECDQRYSCDR